jgi:ABC-type transporter Mla subunit MlaD
MPERVNSRTALQKKWDNIREGTENIDDAAGALSSVLGEVQGIQEEYRQLQEQKVEFKKSIETALPQERPDNKPVKDAVTATKTASAAPASIATVEREKAEV